MHQLHKCFNRNNVKVIYISLPNIKGVINSHNKNISTEPEKPSPCNWRNKALSPLNWICQHKNLIYSCKVSTPDIKQNHLHYTSLTEHTFKERPNKHNNFFKSESRRNSKELYNFMWGKKKKKINVDLLWNISDKPKPYFQLQKNWRYVLQRNITSFSLQRVCRIYGMNW